MKFKWRNVLILLGIILAIILLVDFNRRLEEANRIDHQLAAVRAEATAVMQTQEALVTQVAFASSDTAVEQWAYQGKWVRPGEHPIGLLPAGDATPNPTPVTGSQTKQIPYWRIWWELFFGEHN